MEAILLLLDMIALMLALIWAARNDRWGSQLSGHGWFDYTDGNECEDSLRPLTREKGDS